MNYKNIYAALNQKLSVYPSLPSVVGWENTNIEPVTDELYLKTSLLPIPTKYPFLGEGTQAYEWGIYQIDVMGIKGNGWGPIFTMADSLVTYFARGLVLTYSGQNVKIERAYQSPGMEEDDRWKVAVSVDYHAYV